MIIKIAKIVNTILSIIRIVKIVMIVMIVKTAVILFYCNTRVSICICNMHNISK